MLLCGYRFFIVRSGSMTPTIKTGSVVLVSIRKDYKVGDIITFVGDHRDTFGGTTTHRLVKIETSEGIQFFKIPLPVPPDSDS